MKASDTGSEIMHSVNSLKTQTWFPWFYNANTNEHPTQLQEQKMLKIQHYNNQQTQISQMKCYGMLIHNA